MLKFFKNNPDKAVLLTILLAAAAIRVFFLFDLSLSSEEFKMIEKTRLTFFDFFKMANFDGVDSPIVSILFYFWVKIFGASVWKIGRAHV